MDLTNVALGLSEVSETCFADTLLKRVKNDFYYVLDFYVGSDGKWSCRPMRVDSKREDVPKRIRLYDQPSASKFGVSFSVNSFVGSGRVSKMVETIERLGVPVEGLKDQLGLLKGVSSDTEPIDSEGAGVDSEGVSSEEGTYGDSWYPETEEAMEALWGDVIRLRTGYMTIAVEGRYVVDEEGYDAYMEEQLYASMRLVDGSGRACYLCGSQEDLVHGGVKEPAWKFISTTRTTDVSGDGVAYVRCMDCERKTMRGFYEMQSLVKMEHTKTQAFERLVVPLTRDVKLWRQLKRLRTEHTSDLRYYEALEGLLDRFERRGVRDVLYARILKNKRSYAVLSSEVLRVSDMRYLREREGFVRALREAGWLGDAEEMGYFPEALLASESPYRWKFVDRVKRYWMGIESGKVFDEVEKVVNVVSGTYALYRLWSRYVDVGGVEMVREIRESRRYVLGRLMGFAIRVQERERGYPAFVGYTGRTSIERRFYGYPRDEKRVFEALCDVIAYRREYLTADEWASYVALRGRYARGSAGRRDDYAIGKSRSERRLAD